MGGTQASKRRLCSAHGASVLERPKLPEDYSRNLSPSEEALLASRPRTAAAEQGDAAAHAWDDEPVNVELRVANTNSIRTLNSTFTGVDTSFSSMNVLVTFTSKITCLSSQRL